LGSVVWGTSLALGNSCLFTGDKRLPVQTDPEFLDSIRIIDAHAHPDQFHAPNTKHVDRSSTIQQIRAIGMEASVFAAVGDNVARGRIKGGRSEFQQTLIQLRRIRLKAANGEVRLVQKAADIPQRLAAGDAPGAILAIEGGDALENRTENVERFFKAGVRVITLIHQGPNGLGDSRNTDAKYGGLTPAGREMVAKIQEAGILLDVAHATAPTLKDIAQMSQAPLVDSHTGLGGQDSPSKYFRSWKEMEFIAGTGGVICTWPFRMAGRKTFRDWAMEILLMKERMGMGCVGLGTDGGGNLPELIRGYSDIRDLENLVAAMLEVGLTSDDVRKYMGGNFFRVLEKCIG